MAYSEGEAVLFKKVRATLKYGLHLDAVTPRRGPQSGRCHRSYKIHLSTKYGLHWDAVISRGAREHANEVGALDVTKKATYANISQFLFTFHQIPCKLGEHHKTSLGLRYVFSKLFSILSKIRFYVY